MFDCARKYQDNLVGRNLLFVFEADKGETECFEVSFHARNFAHLTGVRRADGLSSNAFFEKCLDKRLSVNDFYLPKNGSHEQKLRVLPRLFAKNLSASTIGEAAGGQRLDLYTSRLAGDERACMGFVLQNKNQCFVPNTALDTDVKAEIIKPHRILLTYRKSFSEKDYHELVYYAGKVDWERIKLPSGYDDLPLPVREKELVKMS